ncbi:MAG: 3-oxoacyl-ACP synthase III family protein [Bryobacteraceae bacterium]
MAFIRGFGSYLPSRVVSNAEIGQSTGTSEEWIRNVSGIAERRFASNEETVVEMAVSAGRDCLERCGSPSVGLVIVSSGSAERRFPGPAASVSTKLGLGDTPAIDLPVASAGSLYGMVLADRLSASFGRVLVIASERMSSAVEFDAANRGTAVLFGDGAGAVLVDPDSGAARIVGSAIHSDGSFAEDLRLEFGRGLEMNGRSVILQASRKIPRVIDETVRRAGHVPGDVDWFLMHQANQNLIVRIAETLGVPSERFFSNIQRYGNTSSASLLIAASEWTGAYGFVPGQVVVFAAFGAGFHWGALLVEGS